MKANRLICGLVLGAAVALGLAGCGKVDAKQTAGDTAPPPAQVEPDMDPTNVKVDNPGQFPIAIAESHPAGNDINVTGVIGPDVSRLVPVISTATGRVVKIDAKVGDSVKEGQSLFEVRSSDISGAYSDYRHAIANQELAKKQLARAKILLDDGAIPTSQVEIAQTAEDTAVVDVETTRSHLQVLGVPDPDHPTDIIRMAATASGVIVDQQVTIASAVQAFAPSNANPTNPFSSGYPFTISDLGHVWVMCDVFENNLAQVKIGEYADVRLNAYPDRVFGGKVANIGQIMDPNLHTAKVRLELENPGIMRIGMFVRATFHGDRMENHALVPSSAVLHLHDADFVYTPGADHHFRRIQVTTGQILDGNKQEIVAGIKPGDKVVTNALVLQSTVEQ